MQIAAATALSIGAALLVRSMWHVVSADRGFDIDKGFAIQVRLPRSRYPKMPVAAAAAPLWRASRVDPARALRAL